MLILAYLLTYLWFGAINKDLSGLQDFTKKILDDSENKISQQVILGNQFSLRYVIEGSKTFEDSINAIAESRGLKVEEKNIKSMYIKSYGNPENKSILDLKPEIRNLIYLAFEVNNKVIKAALVIGTFWIVFSPNLWRKGTLAFATLASLIILLAFTIIPLVSIKYSPNRTYQQLGVFLALGTITGLNQLTKLAKDKVQVILLCIAILMFQWYYSGTIQHLIGGRESTIIFTNKGADYYRFYTIAQDIHAIKWLNERNVGVPIFSDNTMIRKLQLYYSRREDINLDEILFPQFIQDNGYYLLGKGNVKEGIGFAWKNGLLLTYRIPIHDLEQKKNLVYSSNYSRIYK